MPIEIRELIIRARVAPEPREQRDRPLESRYREHDSYKTVVDDVMRILKDKQER